MVHTTENKKPLEVLSRNSLYCTQKYDQTILLGPVNLNTPHYGKMQFLREVSQYSRLLYSKLTLLNAITIIIYIKFKMIDTATLNNCYQKINQEIEGK